MKINITSLLSIAMLITTSTQPMDNELKLDSSNIPTNFDVFDLYDAAYKGDTITVNKILEAKKNGSITLDIDELSNNHNALHAAAGEGHIEIVKLLIEYGAQQNVLSDNQCSALYFSAEGKGHLAVCKYLLELQIKQGTYNIKNLYELLHYAVNQENSTVAEYLAIMCAQPSIKDKNNVTVLHMAIAQGPSATLANTYDKCYKTIKCLIQKSTQLELPIKLKTEDIINLLQHLDHAIEQKDSDVADYLAKMCAQPSIKDENGATALHLAAENGYNEVVKLLITHGALINAQDNKKCTTLHSAIYKNQAATATTLIFMGADLKIVDDANKTAICVAKDENNTYILEWIKTIDEYDTNTTTMINGLNKNKKHSPIAIMLSYLPLALLYNKTNDLSMICDKNNSTCLAKLPYFIKAVQFSPQNYKGLCEAILIYRTSQEQRQALEKEKTNNQGTVRRLFLTTRYNNNLLGLLPYHGTTLRFELGEEINDNNPNFKDVIVYTGK